MITYYIRDTENKPRITVAVEKILDDDSGEYILARGMALCSMKDNPNKKVGRNIAIGLLRKAMRNMKNCSQTSILRDEALEVLDSCGEVGKYGSEPPWYRCEFNAQPWNDLEFNFLMGVDRRRRRMDGHKIT